MAQTGYLFTAGVTITQKLDSPGPRSSTTLQSWDTCMSAIVHGEDAASAQRTFEGGVSALAKARLKRSSEKFSVPSLWANCSRNPAAKQWIGAAISQKVTRSEPTNDTDDTDAPDEPVDHGEGFWVNVNEVVPPESAQLDIESLKRVLPEDIASGLNWSSDKKFIFLVSSLAPQPVMIEPFDEFED